MFSEQPSEDPLGYSHDVVVAYPDSMRVSAADVANIPLFVQPTVEIWNKKFRGFQPLEYGGGSLGFLEKVWQEKE